MPELLSYMNNFANNTYNNNQNEDDEALARFLQFQEQSGGGEDAVAFRVQQGVALSDQELNDMVLAREMAEMELTATPSRESSGGYGGSYPGGGGSSGGNNHDRGMSSGSHFLGRANNINNNNPTSGSNSLVSDARQLQEQAYQEQQEQWLQHEQQQQQERQQQQQYHGYQDPLASNNRGQQQRSHRQFKSYDASSMAAFNRDSGATTTERIGHHGPSASFDSKDGSSGVFGAMSRMEQQQFQDDLELARRIQQEDMMATSTSSAAAATQPGATYEEPTDDERLARLMASTGRSFRDLTEAEIDDLLLAPRNRQTPPRYGSNAHSSPSSPVAAAGVRPKLSFTPNSNNSHPSAYPNQMHQQQQQLHQHRSAPTTPTAAPKRNAVVPIAGGIAATRSGARRNKPPMTGLPPAGIPPAGIPPPPGPPPPPSLMMNDGIPSAIPPPPRGLTPNHPPCAKCGLYDGTFLKAKESYYHPECFRCARCSEKIDFHSQFGVRLSTTTKRQEPYHAHCLPYSKNDLCVVCQKPLVPRVAGAGSGGGSSSNNNTAVCFVKHPFFSTERMCPEHANRSGGNTNTSSTSNTQISRRCTSCHRFEPLHEPFADLDDSGRCVCFACCRTVIMDGSDLIPLWQQVVHFFEHQMKLPIRDEFRELPVFCVGIQELQTQMADSNSRNSSLHAHSLSTQIMTRGLCLSDHVHCRRLKMPSMKFNWSSSSFEALPDSGNGYTYHDFETTKGNERAKLFAIMVLSGLPRDLTAGILAHQATHAWFQLHPDCHTYPLEDTQVEEGVAQLVAMLFLNEGLEPSQPLGDGDTAPSDEQLRDYYRFCIETDDSEIYGKGYQKAAKAYQEVGIQALLTHVLLYGTFPDL